MNDGSHTPDSPTEEQYPAGTEPTAEYEGSDDPDYGEVSEDDARLIELVGYLVQGIVSHPEEVEVDQFFDDAGSIYGVRVHPEDVGRVIGKEGRIANALRQVVKAAAVKSGARVSVEIITEESSHLLDLSGEDEAGEEGMPPAPPLAGEAQPGEALPGEAHPGEAEGEERYE